MPHPVIFDRQLLRARRARAAALGPATFLLDRVADGFRRAAGGGAAPFRRRASISARRPTRCACCAGRSDDRRPTGSRSDALARRVADEEALPFGDASLDLVVSALALQFVNDLPGTLVQIRRALKPDGLFLAALLGGDTLTELRQSFAAAESEIEGGVSPRVAPFADVRELGALLQRAGFALPVTDVDRLTVRYASPFALMHDLRRMGATNALPSAAARRSGARRLLRMAEIYAERFADPDGRMRATFEIVWLSGWAPHESQQQPLKPGSAKRGSPTRWHAGDAGRREGRRLLEHPASWS